MSTDNAMRRIHASDCARHNGPALPVGKCDCGAASAPVTVTRSDGTTCDVTMTLHRNGRGLPIAYMFNTQRSETLDPADAAEVDADDELIRIESGDRITMTVEF